MEVECTDLEGVMIITPRRFADPRGWFSETYNRRALATHGILLDFVQDNQSLSGPAGTLRGLHFQREPYAQDKLVRCVRGRVLDVAVDLRSSSPTYRKHVAVELSAESGRQLLVPVGFAHGFLTLEEHCQVFYKVTDYYAPDCDGGVIWNDPELDIDWGAGKVTLSDKDAQLPTLADQGPVFT